MERVETIKSPSFSDEQEYRDPIAHDRIPLDEVLRFEEILDGRVSRLLAGSAEDPLGLEETVDPLETLETPASASAVRAADNRCSASTQRITRGSAAGPSAFQLLRRPGALKSLH